MRINFWLGYFNMFLVSIVLNGFDSQAQVNIALIADHIDKQELAAVQKVLDKKFLTYQVLSLQDIQKTNRLKSFTHAWYHRTDTAGFDAQELQAAKLMKSFVSNGGHLFMTMESVPLLNEWGIESTPWTLSIDTVRDAGFGRPLGYHAFKSHPLFEGLSGGVYTSKQKKDHVVRKYGFFGNAIPHEGKVLGIQWTYITFWEDNKLLIEYKTGKGSIIAAGSYLYYNTDNYNQEHLEKFTDNVFRYTAGLLKTEEPLYWDYTERKLQPATFSATRVKPIAATRWKLPSPTLKLTQSPAGNEFYDLVGRRILWMGKVNAGMDEVWIHPYMALKDLHFGVHVKGSDSVTWLRNIPAVVTLTPEYLVREYNIRNTTVKEIYTVSFEHPAGVAHIEVEGSDLDRLSVQYASNLRYMWPYTHKASGSISYGFNKDINGHIISGQSGALTTLIAYSNIPAHEKTSHDTALNQVKVMVEFAVKNGTALNLNIIGSGKSLQTALNTYRSNQSVLNGLFVRSNEYYSSLLNNHLHFITPDTAFNNGYKWALARTDQFLQTTPGIGTALMAGFGTTARGWNGNQKISGRPGYAWYFGRDGQWSSMAINAYGDFPMVKKSLETFIRFQDVNGKIFHELSSSGVVHYDAADATPLFVILAAHYLKYSGDITYIRNIWPAIEHAMQFNYSTDSDRDGLIENTNVGHGWIEGGRLFNTHTEFYLAGCWASCLDAAGYMAKALGKKEAAAYVHDAGKVKKIIDKDFWNDKEQFFHNGKMINGSFMPDATVLATVPIYLQAVTDSLKAELVTRRLAGNAFSTDWGIRMIEETNKNYHPGSYHGGMVWPLYAGWAALAEFQTGHYKSGFLHIMNNLLVYRHWGPGSIEETLNGNIYRPNGVCSHQCWSETMVLQPAIEGMLGYEPDAMKNVVKLAPYFPWDWKFAKVKNIRMNKTKINMDFKRSPDKTSYTINSTQPVNLIFQPAFPLHTSIQKVMINGRTVPAEISEYPDGIRLQLNIKAVTGNTNIDVLTTGGIGALPLITRPEPGDSSVGIKIISEKVIGKTYSLIAEGRPGRDYEVQLYSAGKPKNVLNATLVEKNDACFILKFKLPAAAEKYARQEISIELE